MICSVLYIVYEHVYRTLTVFFSNFSFIYVFVNNYMKAIFMAMFFLSETPQRKACDNQIFYI